MRHRRQRQRGVLAALGGLAGIPRARRGAPGDSRRPRRARRRRGPRHRGRRAPAMPGALHRQPCGAGAPHPPAHGRRSVPDRVRAARRRRRERRLGRSPRPARRPIPHSRSAMAHAKPEAGPSPRSLGRTGKRSGPPTPSNASTKRSNADHASWGSSPTKHPPSASPQRSSPTSTTNAKPQTAATSQSTPRPPSTPSATPTPQPSSHPATDTEANPQTHHSTGRRRTRPGRQRPDPRLAQLLRGLLPLRVIFHRSAHRRTYCPMGNAEVQTIARPTHQSMEMARRCPSARATTLRPLAPPRFNPTPNCGSRMTGDCHVRF